MFSQKIAALFALMVFASQAVLGRPYPLSGVARNVVARRNTIEGPVMDLASTVENAAPANAVDQAMKATGGTPDVAPANVVDPAMEAARGLPDAAPANAVDQAMQATGGTPAVAPPNVADPVMKAAGGPPDPASAVDSAIKALK